MASRVLAGLTATAAALLGWAVGARAEGAPPAPASPLGESLAPAIGQMIMALGLVLALVMGLYLLARRFLPGNAGAGPAGGLRMLGRLPLGPRKWLAMVEVGGKVLLLGIADQSINLLTTLDDPVQVDAIAKARPGFARLLKRAQNAPPEEPQP